MCHEAGHILGITHCVKYKCLMNGANSLRESDSAPIFLCPEDLRKVQWNTQFEVRPRYEKMLAFLKASKLDADAAWLEKHLSHLH
jgi:archaemetzincin